MKNGVMMLSFLIFLNGCSHIAFNMDNYQCGSNADCVPAGCSSQLCVSDSEAGDIVTTCEYREEYACLKFTACGCVENKCQWADTEGYTECLEEVNR